MEDPGVALMFALPNSGVDAKKLEKAMDAEVKDVKNNLISDREMEKLKNQFESKIVRQNKSISRRAQNLARNYTYFEDTDLINHRLDKYLNVTKEDIKRVANEYFSKDNRVVLYYLPKSQKENE